MQTQAIIDFIASIPATIDSYRWKDALSAGLIRLWPEVDRVIPAFPKTLDLSGERQPSERSQVVFSHVQPQTARQRYVLESTKGKTGEYWEKIYHQIRADGIELQEYGEPVGIDAHVDDVWCGSVLLFRRAAMGVVSATTVNQLAQLRPVLAHLFVGHISQLRIVQPTDAVFVDALRRIARDVELTRREEQTLIMLLSGHDYQAVANALYISVKTVEQYVSRLLAKLGCENIKQVFARYMGIEFHAALLE